MNMPSFEELLNTAQQKYQELSSGDTPWIRIGTAVCGHAAGSDDVINAISAELEKRGLQANISPVGCIGLCYAEPIVDIVKAGQPRVFFKNVSVDQVPELVDSYLVNNQIPREMALAYSGESSVDGVPSLDSLPMWKHQVRVAMRNCGEIDPTDIYQYIARGGYAALNKAISRMDPSEVVKEVQDSGLRGRGGAAFSTGTKWSFLVGSPGPTKYILCNCEEGDPGAYNDKGILESDPHTLVEGTILAGYATGASNGVVFIRHGHEGPIDRAQKAIDDCYELGLLGDNILGSEFSFHMEVSLTGESYVAGEETALMESVEGKRAMPRFRPPFPAQSGVWGLPTNINNIKTLSYVPEIISKGGEWFSNIGIERSKGTAILCISGNITRPGMIEVPMGITLKEIMEDVAGGAPGGHKLKFLQTGGPLGGVLSASEIDIPLDFEAMAQAGAILGSGGIIAADDRACAVDMTRLLIAFCQYESCGKCFPCRLGMTNLIEILERICKFESRPDDLALMRSVGQNMAGASLCGHGQLGWNPVQSALKFFPEEFEEHMEQKICRTGQCDGLMITPQRTRSRWTSAQPLELRI
ncbi:MAG: NADH-quinone oxidoreductase subunit F [SAR202 cluster bacterium]|nr:NADH-quinone oxidoreductase subunit F [SAR202 cluster bacterium]|tara:strand:+ start:3082 stop:4833 length:1752 start_codon:yes stop_codon:yes gene_type:complete